MHNYAANYADIYVNGIWCPLKLSFLSGIPTAELLNQCPNTYHINHQYKIYNSNKNPAQSLKLVLTNIVSASIK